MSRTGQSGRLILDNSYIEFGKWNIDENRKKPGGNFRIQESDQGKIFGLTTLGQPIKAELYDGSLKHTRKIVITKFSPSNIINFEFYG
jgi:hypothetical protein